MSHPEQQPVPAHAAPVYGAPAPRELTTLAVLAFVAAALATLCQALQAASVGTAVRHSLDAENGDLGDRAALIGQLAYAVGSVVGTLALLAGWVSGSMWLHRARRNAELLVPSYHHRRSAGWAWGGWICPIVNFWFPLQVVRDTHRAVSPLSTKSVFGWWWACWVAYLLVARIADRVEARAVSSGTGASGAATAETLLAVLMVGALVGWAVVLRTVTLEQRDR